MADVVKITDIQWAFAKAPALLPFENVSKVCIRQPWINQSSPSKPVDLEKKESSTVHLH